MLKRSPAPRISAGNWNTLLRERYFFYGSVGVRMWSWSWVLPPIPPRLLLTSEQAKTHCSSSDLKLQGCTFHQGKGERKILLLHDRLAFMSQSEHCGIPEMETKRQTDREESRERAENQRGQGDEFCSASVDAGPALFQE